MIIVVFVMLTLVFSNSGVTTSRNTTNITIMDTTKILQDGAVVRLTYQKQSRRGVLS